MSQVTVNGGHEHCPLPETQWGRESRRSTLHRAALVHIQLSMSSTTRRSFSLTTNSHHETCLDRTVNLLESRAGHNDDKDQTDFYLSRNGLTRTAEDLSTMIDNDNRLI